MDQMRCPGCGAPYNGKKCRMCLYEPMGTHLSRNTGKTADQKAPFPGRKKRTSAVSIKGILLLLVLMAAALPLLLNWGIKLEAMEAASRTPEPIPGNPAVLFQHESITVLVPEEDSPIVSLWFYNHGKEDAIVVCKEITLNGYRMENTALSVYVPAGSAVKGTLQELETLADELAFAMEAQKTNGEFLFETAPIYLKERRAVYG